MSLLPKFDFPSYFTIRSEKASDGVLMSFTSPVASAELPLNHAPNMADLLELLPELNPSMMVKAFAKAMQLPRMFEFKAEPTDNKARVSLMVFHETKKPKTWSRDFDKPSITIEDLVEFKDLLKEGLEYQQA